MTSNIDKDFEFFICTQDGKGGFLIYDSEAYRLSEIDLINLIKICIVEKRNMGVGRQLLEVYRDSTAHRKEITEERLTHIGIEKIKNDKPTTARKVKHH